jgi:DNA-dependent RNA polymerase auxiliary subunit epsilon
MRYKYKVRELGKEIVQDMEAMSLKKLRRKLDHKKEYAIEYTNKHNNQLIAHISGIEPK